MSNREKFVGLVGLGYWGKNLLRNLYELNSLKMACDSDYNTVMERKEQFPGIEYTTSLEEMLARKDIRAVVVATPAVTHYAVVKQFLLAGKDVFVEKPLALTAGEGEELVGLAKKHGRVLMVGHILQYHPAVIKLKEMVLSGELGKIQYIYSNRLNIGKLRTEENVLWSFAPHDISVILMLVGDYPIKISTFGGDYINSGIADVTITALEFKNGIKGHIFVSWLHPYKEQKLVVVGSKAMAVFDDVSREKLFLYPHKIKWQSGKIPVAQKSEHQVITVDSGEPLKLELEHFLECVAKRSKPRTDGLEGLRVLRVLETAGKAFPEKQNPLGQKKPDYYAHESAYIDEGVQIGEKTKIWHFSHILKKSVIGRNNIIGQNVVIGPEVTIGDSCKIQNNVSIYKGVKLEDEVFCGPSCVFTNVYNPRAFIERKHEFLPTLVKKGATIGANSTIVCGNTIGGYSIIGAGAVVKSDVADYAVVAGVPAKQIGWACRCGTTLKFNGKQAVCRYCGNEYSLEAGKLIIIKES
ncbi:MAG: Gfo/Idh/MocA family oxidoreductase [Thermodesulfovibrionales bacterium]|nr:Gfo/Idh/MocA family oxidoreductase [Thermodesulfovibrionales bacterium]